MNLIGGNSSEIACWFAYPSLNWTCHSTLEACFPSPLSPVIRTCQLSFHMDESRWEIILSAWRWGGKGKEVGQASTPALNLLISPHKARDQEFLWTLLEMWLLCLLACMVSDEKSDETLASCAVCWQEASVSHHRNLPLRLLEHPYDMTVDIPHSKWLKRESMEEATASLYPGLRIHPSSTLPHSVC